MNRPPNVVHENQLEWAEESRPARFRFRRKPLGAVAGGRKLGCSLYEVLPGCRSWPYHYHWGNEEAIYVLEGSGTLRIAGQEVPIAKGDYVALPAGPAGAHQVMNSSHEPLRYLCFSTMIEPDVVVYPDSNKVGLVAGAAPGGPQEKRTFGMFLKADAQVSYWEGEE